MYHFFCTSSSCHWEQNRTMTFTIQSKERTKKFTVTLLLIALTVWRSRQCESPLTSEEPSSIPSLLVSPLLYLLAGDKVHRTNSLPCLLSLSCTLPHSLSLRFCVPQAFIASKFILSRGQGAEQGRIGYMDTYLIPIEFVTRFFFFHPSINVNATLLPRAASPVRLYLTSSLQQLATASIGMCMSTFIDP